MKQHFIYIYLLTSLFSCTPDGKFDEAYAGDTSLSEFASVDTFSVKKTKALTEAEKNQLELEKREADSIINEASTIINSGNPDRSEVVSDDAGIVLNPDLGPSFPGGSDAMDAYILKKKIYPLVAFQNEIKGTVNVKFVVEKDGKIGGIRVLRGLGYGCDESAIDLIRGMPRWSPGKKGGANVRCTVTLPISFGL